MDNIKRNRLSIFTTISESSAVHAIEKHWKRHCFAYFEQYGRELEDNAYFLWGHVTIIGAPEIVDCLSWVSSSMNGDNCVGITQTRNILPILV